MSGRLDRVVDALHDHGSAVHQGTGGHTAQCPSHADRSPSLSLGAGHNGGVVLHCHAGCGPEDVVAALGLDMADLAPEDTGHHPPAPRVVATYTYTDEQERPLYEVRRIEPGENGRAKTFRPYLPGAQLPGLGRVRHVLYNLPAAHRAAAAGQLVYVCEGEKDCDRLAALGYTATCNLGGAGKWRPEYSADLVDAHVVVVADRDGGGLNHARRVATALSEYAASVRKVLPAVEREHADLSDHLNAGHGLEALVPLDESGAEAESGDDESGADGDADLRALAAAYAPLDWHALWEQTPEEVPWLCEPLIAAGRLVAVYSPAKAGKSLLLLEVAAGLATGRPVLGNPARSPQRVVYVDIENSGADVQERLQAMGYGPGDLDNLVYYSFPSLPELDSREGGRHLLALAVAHGAELVVIDTVSRVIAGKENDSDTFHALYRHALAPLKGRGVAVIRLDHSGKDAEQGQRGSSAKASDVDAVWMLIKRSETSIHLKRQESRSAHGSDLVQLTRRGEPLRHEVVGGPEPVNGRVSEVVATLDELALPDAVGRDRARKALADSGHKVGTGDLAAAIKARKDRGDLSATASGENGAGTGAEPVRPPDPRMEETPSQTCPGQGADTPDSTPAADLSALSPSPGGDSGAARVDIPADGLVGAGMPEDWGEWSA
ncbi:hypothetical protein HNR25_005174 [Streptomonospora salina]|uniref:AAA+ ATPase domain-containing protein n=1 Tax=Streptomonospora salina TaxID=104205 RepID=A0A841EJZ2_9ACTN|nr:AAA family ATPase [Streptomonospora salina]MBB6001343.1 hypothetical protein [Streptomonospora salina]